MAPTTKTAGSTRQQVKEWSERTVANLGCPACMWPTMTVVDEPARDLHCANPQCGEYYELKAKRSDTGAVRTRRFASGSFAAYQRRFATEPPNLLFLSYAASPKGMEPRSLAVVPRTLVSTDLLVPNKESKTRAQRTLRLCRIDADCVPPLAMVPIMTGGHRHQAAPAATRLQQWYRLSSGKGTSARWRRNVLRAIGWLNATEFTLKELEVFTPWFQQEFKGAKTPTATMRRVLQELRDAGAIEFLERGCYRLR